MHQRTLMGMELKNKLESSILDIYPLMPSSGAWPFTMIAIERNALGSLILEKPILGSSFLLVLSREDFTDLDLMDYATNSKEYDTMSQDSRLDFLIAHKNKFGSTRLQEWAMRITSLGVGLVTGTAANRGLELRAIEILPAQLDTQLGFDTAKLKTVQLFEVVEKSIPKQ